MLFQRSITPVVVGAASRYRALTLLGPRQSGKTTLARALFQNHAYLSLENPDVRLRALEDPRAFLSGVPGDAILDEVQRAPDLLSYLQEILDTKSDTRRFVLTGSDSLLLSDKVAQSLAGRTRLLHVLPMFRRELPADLRPSTLDETLWKGGYPRIFDERLDPREWYGDYYQTYVEKDVRNILAIDDLAQFDRFVRLCAGRAGQLTNYAALASDTGISQPTAVKWSSVLQTSFVTFLLAPHFKNFNKRITKSPKLYFYDTGLLCYLLRIRSPEDLATHPLRGAIFENWVVGERRKQRVALGEDPPYYFWRDQHGHEVDLVEDRGTWLELCEIKSGATYQSGFASTIHWLNELQKRDGGSVVFGGDSSFAHAGVNVIGWAEV